MAVRGGAVRVFDRVSAVAKGQFRRPAVRRLRLLAVQQRHNEPVPEAQAVQDVDVQRATHVPKVPTAQRADQAQRLGRGATFHRRTMAVQVHVGQE